MNLQPTEIPGYGRVGESGNIAPSRQHVPGYGERLPQALGEREHMGVDASGTTVIRYPSTELMWDPRWGRQEDVVTRHDVVPTDAAVVVMRAMDRARQAEEERVKAKTPDEIRAWRRKWLNL